MIYTPTPNSQFDTMTPLKIWTDFDLEQWSGGSGVILPLLPFRGQSDFERDADLNPLAGRFDELEREGQKYLALTSLEEADVAVFPISYPLETWPPGLKEATAEFARKVSAAGKRTLVFAGGDHDIVDVELPDPIVFHSSLYASRRRPFEFGITQPIEDLVARYVAPADGSLAELYPSKSARPSVGFCGFAPPLGVAWNVAKLKASVRLLLNYAGYMRRHPSKSAHSYRARALRGLLRQRKVATDFLIRDQFAFAGIYGQLQPGGSAQSAERMRREYARNILDNPYNLCVRGIGNYSLRLFETLCCGRVPVLVDTDCVLPFDFAIDWRQHVVWVEENQIDNIAGIVADFHASHSQSEFVDLQKRNRQLWQEYLSPLGFVKHIPLCVAQADKAARL